MVHQAQLIVLVAFQLARGFSLAGLHCSEEPGLSRGSAEWTLARPNTPFTDGVTDCSGATDSRLGARAGPPLQRSLRRDSGRQASGCTWATISAGLVGDLVRPGSDRRPGLLRRSRPHGRHHASDGAARLSGENHFAFSYTPIRGEEGAVQGSSVHAQPLRRGQGAAVPI
jgi:hypothetical protein